MSMFGGLDNPHIVHALAVHVPVAMALLGVVLGLMCAVTQMKNVVLRRLAIGWYVAMAAISFATVLTGERTLDAIPGTVPVTVREAIAMHETLGENVWIAAVVTALMTVCCGAKKDGVRNTFTVLMVLACTVTATWVGITGWYGTALVYRDGVGNPKTPAAVAAETLAKPEMAPNAPATPGSTAASVPGAAAVPGDALSAPANVPAVPAAMLSANHERYIDRLSKIWDSVFGFLWPAH